MKKTKEIRKLEIGDVNDQEAIRLLSRLYVDMIIKPSKKDYLYDININIPNCNHEKASHIIDDLYYDMVHEDSEVNKQDYIKRIIKTYRKMAKKSNKKDNLYDVKVNIPNCNYEKTFYIISNLHYNCTTYRNLEKGNTQ